MNASYSIPETAKLTGIPEHAIREYAKQFADVLPVPETSGDTGRWSVKRYPDCALAVFRSIRKLKDDGFDPHQIRTALSAEKLTETTPDLDNIALKTAEETALTAAPADDPEACEAIGGPAAEGEEPVIEAAEPEAPGLFDEQTAPVELEATFEEEVIVESAPEAHEEFEATSDESPAAPAVETDVEAPAWSADTEATEPVTEPAAEESPAPTATATFHPVFTNLDDGLRQLRKIMDDNTLERESLHSEREALLADTAAKHTEIESLKATVTSQEEKISGLQSALGALMAQCDQQLQAIRSALGQA